MAMIIGLFFSNELLASFSFPLFLSNVERKRKKMNDVKPATHDACFPAGLLAF